MKTFWILTCIKKLNFSVFFSAMFANFIPHEVTKKAFNISHLIRYEYVYTLNITKMNPEKI